MKLSQKMIMPVILLVELKDGQLCREARDEFLHPSMVSNSEVLVPAPYKIALHPTLHRLLW
jgi:hypothetical protein